MDENKVNRERNAAPIDVSKIKPVFKAPYPDQVQFVQTIDVPPGVKPSLKGVLAAQILLNGDKWFEQIAKWLPVDALKWVFQGAAGGIKLARKYYGVDQ